MLTRDKKFIQNFLNPDPNPDEFQDLMLSFLSKDTFPVKKFYEDPNSM